MLIVLWMTRSISEDIPGWGALFEGRVGDGTVSVSIITEEITYISIRYKVYISWGSWEGDRITRGGS